MFPEADNIKNPVSSELRKISDWGWRVLNCNLIIVDLTGFLIELCHVSLPQNKMRVFLAVAKNCFFLT
jgi:hypothetical protein